MPCREDLARHIPWSLTQVANTPAHLPVVRASSHPSRPSLKHETAMKTANLHSRPGLFAIFLMAGGLIGWRTARTRRRAVSATPRPPWGTGGLSISPAHLRVAGMLLLFVVLPQLVWATPVLDAYALSAAGHANGPGFSCSTFGPDHRTDKFGASYQVGLPNAGCGVGEDSREATASTGSIMAASSLKVAFSVGSELRTYDGSSAGRAKFGDLGVSAQATYAGSMDTFTVIGSQAGALQVETMTFHGGSGSGVFVPTFTIDGSLSNVGRTENQMMFSYAINDGPQYLGFRIQGSRGDLTFYAPGGYVAGFPGMTTSGDLVNGVTVSGTTQFTLNLPIQFDTPTVFTFALWAAVLPSSSVGLLGPSAGDVSFLTSAMLTGIEVLGSDGRPVSNFTIDAASGTRYGSTGVIEGGSDGIPVPEPSGLELMLLGLAVYGGLSWRRAHGRQTLTRLFRVHAVRPA